FEARRMWGHFCDSLSAEGHLPAESRMEVYAFDYLGLFRACPDAVRVLADARRLDLRIGVLSNSVLPRLESSSAPLALADLVDVIGVPAMSGLFKPNPAAYLDVAWRLGVTPEKCLFFDDEPSRVEGARRAGMQGYLVDRTRSEHSIQGGVMKDLSAVSAILEPGRSHPAGEELERRLFREQQSTRR